MSTVLIVGVAACEVEPMLAVGAGPRLLGGCALSRLRWRAARPVGGLRALGAVLGEG